jgi:hypothetical protein
LEPDPELEPELPLELPMFGHGVLPCVPDFGVDPPFCAGAGVEGVDVVGALDVELDAAVLVVPGDAAAPEMPATAPPAARAPVTIVAPSSLEMVISWDLLGSFDRLCRASSVAELSGPVGRHKQGDRCV